MRPINKPMAVALLAPAILLATSLLATAQESAQATRLAQVARLDRALPNLAHPLDPAIEIAKNSLRHVQENVDDYTALFVKRCRVDGDLPPLQYCKLKFRNRKIVDDQIASPMSVYLDFLKPSSVKGREVIWVENENEGNLVVHQGGFAGLITLELDPEGSLAMRGQRYPIKELGIENLLHKVLATGRSDREHGECEVVIQRDMAIGKSRCTVIEITHPEKRDHFRFHKARLYFDDELNLPIRYQAWLWPRTPGGNPVLDEEYSYFNMKVNVGLSASDFDRTNPDYRYH